MAIGVHFISGKPGAGKSYWSTKVVLDVLQNTFKAVVTNLPLRVPEICAELVKRCGNDRCASSRIVLLAPEDTGQFWLVYGRGLRLDENERYTVQLPGGRTATKLNFKARFDAAALALEKQAAKIKLLAETSKADAAEILEATIDPPWDGGVCYVIDEAHEFFNSRDWKDLEGQKGRDALHYLSQHRKLGDEIYFVTQHVRNVDTQLRRVAQDYTYCRNHRKEKLPLLGGLFRSVPIITVSTYLEEFTGAPGQLAMATDWFRLQPDSIGKCYDTAAGVGVRGMAADTGEKSKGLSPVWLLVAVLVFAFGLWYIPDAVAGMAGKTAQDRRVVALQTNSIAAGSPSGSVSPAGPVQSASPNAGTVRAGGALLEVGVAQPVFLTGVAGLPGQKDSQIFLSNGRTLTTADPGVRILRDAFRKPSGVLVGTNIYHYRDLSIPDTNSRYNSH